MTTRQCAGTNKDGSQCKKRISEGELCYFHQKVIDEKAKQASELEEAAGLQISAYNRQRIEFLLVRPEFDFKNADLLLNWLFENARKSNRLLYVMLDIFEGQQRL